MPGCLMSKDQPLRVQLTNNGVVHAGRWDKTYKTIRRIADGQYMTIPPRDIVRIACSWKEVPEGKIISNKNSITCKNCQKKIGLVEGPVFPDRFVIRNTKTGQFFKNTTSRCSAWADDLTDAFLWKRRGDAENRCKTGGWYDEEGNRHHHQKYIRDENGIISGKVYKYKQIRNPDLEIKRVKITIVEE